MHAVSEFNHLKRTILITISYFIRNQGYRWSSSKLLHFELTGQSDLSCSAATNILYSVSDLVVDGWTKIISRLGFYRL